MTAAFLYVMGTEVFGRWSEAFQAYGELKQKEETMLSPEQLADKKMSLIAKKRTLAAAVTKDADTFEQSQTGVFEFLNSCAKSAGVRYQSLVPAESQSSSQIKEVGFKINFFTSYHRVGLLLNLVETGAMPMHMKKLELTSETKESPTLQVSMEGVAFIVPQTLLQ